MNPLVIALAAVFIFSGGVTVGIKWEAGEVAKREQGKIEARQEALSAAAKEIAKIDVKRVTIRQPLEREVHEKVVYRDCQHTPDGLLRLNQALGGSGAAGGIKLPGNTGATLGQ